jgi:MFS family permease
MMNGVNQIVGGLLAFCFSHVPATAPIKSWQALFITYGVITVFWGIFVGWWMPDSPMKAHCFSEEDKRLMVERVRKNRTGLQNRKFRKDQLWDALTDPQGEKDLSPFDFLQTDSMTIFSLCDRSHPVVPHNSFWRPGCF